MVRDNVEYIWLADNILEAYITGIVDYDLLLGIADSFSAIEIEKPGYDAIFNFADIAEVEIGHSEIFKISRHIKENDDRKGDSAFVVGPKKGRVILGTLYTTLVNVFTPGKSKVFESKIEAEFWLSRDRESR
ncbi:MAG: hypothetical protein OQJ97_15310 [Rhodospirillales bacterium]|nr:hypothetical protein [Rhodospirillales bacterium]